MYIDKLIPSSSPKMLISLTGVILSFRSTNILTKETTILMEIL